MPLFGRKKSEKVAKDVRPKSKFFDTPTAEPVKHDIDQHPANANKRRSKSKFYEDIPTAPQTTDSFDTQSINSTNSHSSSKSIPPTTDPPKPLSVETQGDLGAAEGNSIWKRRVSILSRSFADILCDRELITYFIQYMNSKDRGHLVKFWLDSENFTQAALSRIRVHSMHSVVDGPQSLIISSLNNKPLSSNPVSSPDHTSANTTLTTNNSLLESNTDKATSRQRNSTQDELQERIKEDAVNIYSRYIALDCQSSIGISEELRNSTISRICSEDGKVDPQCFRDCQKYTEEILENEYYKDFLESSYYRKYQIDILTSNRLHLIDILYNDTIMFYFMEFLEQEGASRLVQFWMSVDNFQSQLESDHSNYASTEAQSDAMIIYGKYFSLQASEPLGFTDKVRMHIEVNICREEGPLPDCFLIPKIIILETIEKTLFTTFLQSQIYFRFLSELINSVQSNHHSNETPKNASKRSHHRAGSNASYDSHSIGGHSTLHDEKVSGASSASDLHHNRVAGIDEDQPLWKRVHQRNAMSLGHLSEFGQYVSELDIEQVPDLDKKKGNRFSRKKKEKEKAQEDMAWQIAKMIIDDINKEVSTAQNKSDTTSETAESITSGIGSSNGEQGEMTHL